jgi:hypothetical protein
VTTDQAALENFLAGKRLWQGIPSIERTKGGRIFVTFYSGGKGEGAGNFCVLVYSDDDGKTFTDATAVLNPAEGERAYDPCLWIDPAGRLWWSYCSQPAQTVRALICDDPDGEIVFQKDVLIGGDVMMNKPTVLSDGTWLFACAVWRKGSMRPEYKRLDEREIERKSFVVASTDNGATFARLGGVAAPERSFDEHMVLERRDGSLAMYIRTSYGIDVAYSFDKGATWTEAQDSKLGGPNSRFFIRRLKSGRVLLVNHIGYDGIENAYDPHKKWRPRNKLAAVLSEDDGATWIGGLLLDARPDISYPDGTQDANGDIWIVHDRDRHGDGEIIVSRFTEEDVLTGNTAGLVSRIAGKLTN